MNSIFMDRYILLAKAELCSAIISKMTLRSAIIATNTDTLSAA